MQRIVLLCIAALMTILSSSVCAQDLIRFNGKVSGLRVQNVESPYGSGNNNLDAELIVTFQGSDLTLGLTLQKGDDNLPSHQIMADFLAQAMKYDYTVSLTYQPIRQGSKLGNIVQVTIRK